MKSLKCRSVLIALADLLWTSGCMADEFVVVLNSATLSHDKRVGKPVLNLIFAEICKGNKIEFRVDDRVAPITVTREQITFAHMQIDDPRWTDQAVTELARQFSEAPKEEIELRPSSPSN